MNFVFTGAGGPENAEPDAIRSPGSSACASQGATPTEEPGRLSTARSAVGLRMASAVYRNDQRDLSIFRFGFDMFERCVLNNEPISIWPIPYLSKLSGN
jgi:hypothetical protein